MLAGGIRLEEDETKDGGILHRLSEATDFQCDGVSFILAHREAAAFVHRSGRYWMADEV